MTHCPKHCDPVARTAARAGPGSPIRPPETLVDCGVYVDGQRLPGKYTLRGRAGKVHEIETQRARTAFVWVGLHEPDETQMQAVADVFGLHPLAVEDAVHAHQRPKLERYDDTLFLVLKTVNYVAARIGGAGPRDRRDRRDHDLRRQDFVVTVRHGEHGGLADVRKRMDADPEHLRLGPYAVMHAIADHVVDHYLEVTESDGNRHRRASRRMAFSPDSKIDVEPIYLLKREVVELRRASARCRSRSSECRPSTRT